VELEERHDAIPPLLAEDSDEVVSIEVQDQSRSLLLENRVGVVE
jgi:hypothetical protein